MCHNWPLLKLPVFFLICFLRLFYLCGEQAVVMMIMRRVLWEGIMHHPAMFEDDQ